MDLGENKKFSKNAKPTIKRRFNQVDEETVSEQIHYDGRAAFHAGLKITDNPYPVNHEVWSEGYVQWKNWENGWRYAQMVQNTQYKYRRYTRDMGWTSGWYRRDELVNYLLKTESDVVNGIRHEWRTVKKAFRGTNLWTIKEHSVEGREPERYIMLYMLKKFGEDDWGYKDVSVGMGPAYYTCPTSWFDEVPVENEIEANWRKACLERTAKPTPPLVEGATITFQSPIMFSDNREGKTFNVFRQGRAWRFIREDGVVVRLSRSALNHIVGVS